MMNRDDHPSELPPQHEIDRAAEEVASVAVAVAAAIAAQPPDHYISDERGVVPIDSMHPNWSHNAERAVRQGRRPIDAAIPGMEKALHEQGRGHTNS
jgi:hypothetical protein